MNINIKEVPGTKIISFDPELVIKELVEEINAITSQKNTTIQPKESKGAKKNVMAIILRLVETLAELQVFLAEAGNKMVEDQSSISQVTVSANKALTDTKLEKLEEMKKAQEQAKTASIFSKIFGAILAVLGCLASAFAGPGAFIITVATTVFLMTAQETFLKDLPPWANIIISLGIGVAAGGAAIAINKTIALAVQTATKAATDASGRVSKSALRMYISNSAKDIAGTLKFSIPSTTIAFLMHSNALFNQLKEWLGEEKKEIALGLAMALQLVLSIGTAFLSGGSIGRNLMEFSPKLAKVMTYGNLMQFPAMIGQSGVQIGVGVIEKKRSDLQKEMSEVEPTMTYLQYILSNLVTHMLKMTNKFNKEQSEGFLRNFHDLNSVIRIMMEEARRLTHPKG